MNRHEWLPLKRQIIITYDLHIARIIAEILPTPMEIFLGTITEDYEEYWVIKKTLAQKLEAAGYQKVDE